MKITSFDLRTKPKEEIYRKRTIRDLFCPLRHHKNINCFSFFAEKNVCRRGIFSKHLSNLTNEI
jgi:hypothetical protein